MGNSSSYKQKLEGAPVVIVIGGGFVGTKVAKALDSHFNVLLIDRKNYFFNNVAALRACVQPGFVNNILVPYDKLLKYGHIIQAEVQELSPEGFVRLNGREEPVKFDYLVITTGTAYAFPCKVAEPNIQNVPARYEEILNEIQKAENITIIGGGPVGCEMLGEINEKFPNKKITLIHSRAELCPGPTSAEFKNKLRNLLQGLSNVKLLLEERVVLDQELSLKSTSYLPGKRTIKTNKDTEIETDLILFCNGAKVNNKSYKNTFAHVMDESGRLKVNSKLQVEGYTNIFALGDCANVNEMKMAYYGGLQAAVATKNLKEQHSSGRLKDYTTNPPGMLVPIGSKKGVSQLPIGKEGTVVGNFITSNFKGKGLFIGQTCSELNQPVPKELAQIQAQTANLKEGDAQLFNMSEQGLLELKKGLPVESTDDDHT